MLTPTQTDILRFIQECCANTGIPPSFREIQKHFGYRAVGTVQDHVKALIKKGVLEAPQVGKGRSRRARGVIPKDSKRRGLRLIPIYGEIAAGLARENPQVELGQLEVPLEGLKDDCFALRVVGNSMIDVGILEGDILLVEKQEFAKNGDIVVALLEGETTVKRYQETADGVVLIPENKKMSPIRVKSRSLAIQGKVVGLQRKIK